MKVNISMVSSSSTGGTDVLKNIKADRVLTITEGGGGVQIIDLQDPDNPRFALAIKVWKRLPLKVTTALGPLIVKNLP